MENFQKNYNWLISDCEACSQKLGHAIRIQQSGKYAWISGEELTNIIKKMIFSGFGQFYPDLKST